MSTPSPANGGFPAPIVTSLVHVIANNEQFGDQPLAAIVTGVANGGNNVHVQVWPPASPGMRLNHTIRHESVAAKDEPFWRWPK